jgi:hypothetical protein
MKVPTEQGSGLFSGEKVGCVTFSPQIGRDPLLTSKSHSKLNGVDRILRSGVF